MQWVGSGDSTVTVTIDDGWLVLNGIRYWFISETSECLTLRDCFGEFTVPVSDIVYV